MDTAATSANEVGSPAQPLRVFLLNSHELVRRGLRELLEEEGFEVAGEGGSAAETARLVPRLNPDVVLVNDRLTDDTGIEVCRSLRLTAPGVKCLILTSWDEQHAARATVLAGASGYVLKQIGDNYELFNGIRSVAAGRSLLGPGVRERLSESLYAIASAVWLAPMTGQEREVLAFMARGLTNRQIGQRMALPDTEVAACVSAVLEKLGFRRPGRPAAAAVAGAREPLH